METLTSSSSYVSVAPGGTSPALQITQEKLGPVVTPQQRSSQVSSTQSGTLLVWDMLSGFQSDPVVTKAFRWGHHNCALPACTTQADGISDAVMVQACMR